MKWGRIMGTAIAENTEKVWYKDHILYLQISNPVWKNELGFAKTKIKDIVNREIGEPIVHEVKIV
jgi:predicted nucleic acid-binding Zn ribbon protein